MGIFLACLGCVFLGALIGMFCMALAVAARDNPRLWAIAGAEGVREPLVDETDEPDDLDDLDDAED